METNQLKEGQLILEAAMEALDTAEEWLRDNAKQLAAQGIEWKENEGAKGNKELATLMGNFAATIEGLLANFPILR